MADLGREMISKIVAERNIIKVMNAGVRVGWFNDQEHQKVYRWMTEYFSRYKETPTRKALHSNFPNYRFVSVPEPYDFYIDHFRDQRQRSILVDGVLDADDALKQGDSGAASAALSHAMIQLGKEVNSLTDQDAVRTVFGRFRSYKELKNHLGKLTGIATGFPTLDRATGGYQKEQFVVFTGQQKHAKSFILMRSAIAAQDYGKKVLFISFEMSQNEQLARYDAMCGGVNATKLMNGELSLVEMAQLKKGMKARKGLSPFLVSTDISASTTISGLAGKIDQHRPDIVFIDGVYLMEDESKAQPQSAQAYTAISRGLKRLAQRIKRPVICTTQALPGKMDRSKKITLYSIGYTSAFGQDADLILGVEKHEDIDYMVTLRVVAGRNVRPFEISIQCNWNRSEFEEGTDEPDDD